MKQIANAFVKAKQDFAPALKTSLNPHFKNKYADLAACIQAVDDAFLKNGIVMYQETFEDDSGVTVETVLLHESGESIRCGKLHVPASKQDPQGYGSALSYCRRYSLMAACGIAPEDDDGEAARKAPPQKATFQPKPSAELEADLQAFTIAMEDSDNMKTLVEVWGKASEWMKQNRVSEDVKNALVDCKNAAKNRIDEQKVAA